MRVRHVIAFIAVALMVLAPTAVVAQASENGSRDTERADQQKVTGGGQVIASTSEMGPGDTVGFTAISTDEESDDARGEFQAVETSAAGEEMLIFDGVVTCLEVDGDTARFGGHERGDEDNTFTVDVTDNGQGADADDDVVVFQEDTDAPCGDGDQVFSETTLARGNATIHNGDDG